MSQKKRAREAESSDEEDPEGSTTKVAAVLRDTDSPEEEFDCGFEGCTYVCLDFGDYQSHYRCCHANICSACGESFCAPELLAEHIDTTHNVFRRIAEARMQH